MRLNFSPWPFAGGRKRVRRPGWKGTVLAGSLAVLLAGAVGAEGQTFTSPGTRFFTDFQAWNFGAGPLPAGSGTLALTVQNFNVATALTATNDLGLTLNTLNVANHGAATLTLGSALVGGYAFAGGAGQINNVGSGTLTQITAPLTLGEGLGSLTIDGAGGAELRISGTITSNSGAGAPLIIATDAPNPSVGIVRLQGANSFLGGIQLNSGLLALTNTRALGDRTNGLTVNGGLLELLTTVTHNIVLNANLSITSPSGGFVAGAISGTGGLDVRPSGALTETFSGINTYTGSTTVAQTRLATGTVAIPSILRVNGAAGSIGHTASINVLDGMVFEINKTTGDSAANARVNPATPIEVTGGFVQLFGPVGGLSSQALGPLTSRGATMVISQPSFTSAATSTTFANLTRADNGFIVFTGRTMGSAAAVAGATQANIFLTQINGAAPASALVGGGGAAGTTTMSILPWALGSPTGQTASNYAAGSAGNSGFVTYGPNGVRPLDPAEYAFNFATVQPTENLRMTGSSANPSVPVTINSLLFSANSNIGGGSNTVTITSGALAAVLTSASLAAPVNFGAGGAGEAIVTVVGGVASTNFLGLDGALKGSTLTKSGGGILSLTNTGNVFSSNLITINAGTIAISALNRLGIANAGTSTIAIHGWGPGYGNGLIYSAAAASPETLNAALSLQSGHGYVSLQNGGNLTLAGPISGPGGLGLEARTAVGSTLTLTNAANDYTGGTRIAGSVASTIQFSSDGNFGAVSGPIVFGTSSGLTLKQLGTWTTSRQIAITGAVGSATGGGFDTNGFDATWSGNISGSSALFKIDNAVTPGTWTITSKDNPYSGTITLGSGVAQGGRLALSGSGALNSASITFGTSLAPPGTYVVDLSGAADIDATDGSPTPWRSFGAINTGTGFTQTHSIQLGATAGAPVDLRVATGTYSGLITGFGKLVKVGSDSLSFPGPIASTFTGGVEIWGGTMGIANENQLGNSANGVMLRGGTLASSASLAASRAITLGPTPAPLLDGSGNGVALVNGLQGLATISIDGVISGAGGVRFSGSNAVTLGNAANSYLGDTQLAGTATLIVTEAGNLGSTGNRLQLTSGTLQSNAAAEITMARTVVITGTPTLTGNSPAASWRLTGPLLAPANASLGKTGLNTVTLTADNRSFFGTISMGSGSAAGTLAVSSTGQLRRGTVTLNANAAATLDLSGLAREFNSVGIAAADTVALGTGGALTTGFNNAAMTWQGSVTGNTTASVTKTGTGALMIQNNVNTFRGGFHLLSGSATLSTASGNVGALPLESALTVGGWGDASNAGATLTLDDTGGAAARLDPAQAIHSNAGTLVFSTNASAASSQSAGSLRGAGLTTVTMTTGGALDFADVSNGLTRVDRGTFLFRAGNATMGFGVPSTSVANITFGNSASVGLIGSGAPGTTMVKIFPYAIGGITTGDAGSGFVTYDTNGVRLLLSGEYVLTANAATLAGGTSTNNMRLGNTAVTTTQITGGVALTINSLLLAGTASTTRVESATTERLVLTSGALLNTAANVWSANAAGTAGVPLGVQTVELQTGSGNTQELNVFTPADLALGARVTTSGGLTKSGAGALFLTNATNSYAGPTTINAGALVIDDKAALGGSTNLVIGGGFWKYRGADSTLTGMTVKAAGGSGAGLGGSAGFHVASGTTLTLPAAAVSGNGGVLKDGTGVLRLHGVNTNSGATIINGGALSITQPEALGTNSRVLFGTGLSTSGGQTLRFEAPMTLTQEFVTNTADAGVGFGFDTNGSDVTLSGTLLSTASTRGLYKLGAGELNLTAMEMYTGSTQVYGGTLRLSGANGSIVNAAGINGFGAAAAIHLSPGTALVLDNAAANNNNRLPDVWETPFGTGTGSGGRIFMFGGELKIIGNAAGTTERVNQADLVAGTVTLSGGGTQLISGRVFRLTAQTPVLIRGTNLGGTPGPSSTNWFAVDLGAGSTQLGGAAGAKGTPFISIVPGFMGDPSATGSGTDLVTYGTDTGFRLLTASEYAGAIPANISDLSRAPNVALSGQATVNETTAVTALKLGAGGSVSGGGTLQFGQSTILATGNASISVPVLNTQIAAINPGFDFLVSGGGTTLTIGSALASGPAVKFGDGTLVLDGRYLPQSAFTIAQGTVQLGANGGLPSGATVTIYAGGTLDLGGKDRVISGITRAFNIGSALAAGQVVIDGTVALGANRLTIYDNGTTLFSGAITGSGGMTKGLASNGASTFTRPLAYTGSTRIFAGELELRGAATLASTQIELRGGGLTFNNADDNAFAGGYVADRVGAAAPITLAGGTITFTENANAIAVHQLGTLNLTGGGKIAITQTGVSAPSTTTIANITRTKGTVTFTATNLGLAQAANGNARVFATTINGTSPESVLLGGGGFSGPASGSIVPWAWSADASSFVTYGSNGFRPLAAVEYAATMTDGSSTENNVKLAANASLFSATTINSLNTGFDVSGVGPLTVASGALAATSATTVGIDAALKSGFGDSQELVFNVANATGTLRINGAITTSGGVTKTGPGILNLAGANTFTGGLNIDEGQITYTSDAQLGSAANGITFGGNRSALTGRGLQFNGVTAGTVTVLNRPLTLNGYGAIGATSNAVLRLTGAISGAGTLGLSTSSTASTVFELNGANSFAGDVVLNRGLLSIASDAALGGGSALILLPGSSTEGVFLRGDWPSARTIDVAATASLNTNGRTATLSGQIFGGGAFTKSNAGTLIVTEPMAYAGLLGVDAGELRLQDRGSLAANANGVTVNANAALTLDDRGVHFSDRLHDTAVGFALNAANFSVLGNAGATTEEVIGNLALGTGPNVITIAPGSGRAAIVRLTGSVTNSATAATLFRGANLGLNEPGTVDSANLIFTNAASQSQAFALTGGGAPAGHPSVSIVKGGFGDATNTGLGTQLVTYEQDKGVRLLTASEYTSTLVDGSVVTDNIQLTSSKVLAAATTANALWLNGGGSVTGAGTLTLTAATILATGSGNSIATPLAAASNVLAIGGPGDLGVNAAISGSGGLAKMGAGTLTLSVNSSYTGNTWLQGGAINVSSAFPFGSSTVRFVDGTLSNTSAGPLSITNNVQVDGVLRIGGAQNLTLGGPVTINNATREFNITNTGVTTISGQILATANLAGVGFIKTGPGLLVLTGNSNQYGDSSGTNRFYESYTDVNGGELRADNGSGSATGGSQLRVNIGGTLSGLGTVGPTALLGGRIEPGDGGLGALTTGDLSFSGGTLSLEIASAASADSVIVVGAVSFGANTELSLSLTGGYVPALNDQWTIVSNDGGDALGLGAFRFTSGGMVLEPGVVFVQVGSSFYLDYAGGSGNDVRLIAVPEPGTCVLFGATLGVVGFARRRRAGLRKGSSQA